MSVDELMERMWDEEVVGITNQIKPLTAEEVLATRKVVELRFYAKGHYEVAIPWHDDEPPLYCNRTTDEDRLYSLEKHLQRRPDVAEKIVADTSIHTMVDALLLAYAAVSYVRHKCEDGKVTVRLLQ